MLTPAVFAPVVAAEPDARAVVVIWRRTNGRGWDYFCRAPFHDVERIVWLDRFQTGSVNEDYEVRRG
jgi:hypothetical protein